MRLMEYAAFYKCLADENRLRMLKLLSASGLCGCHLVETLGLDQVTVSKQLNYMKRLGLLESNREGQWMTYHVVGDAAQLLKDTLRSLAKHGDGLPPFEADNKKLAAVKRRMAAAPSGSCAAP